MSAAVLVLLGAIAYTYAGYPLLCFLWSRLRRFHARENPEFLPRVTVIVTAFNEEKSIIAKIRNILTTQYPADRFDILVASDGSTDSTDALVGSYPAPNIHLLRVEGRQGKTAAQNAAAAHASGDILVFTDATTDLHPEAISRLTAPLADPRVGCVAGLLSYKSLEQTTTGSGGQKYWQYEATLRAFESRSAGLIGVSGCLYSLRKIDYRPLRPEIISDFAIALDLKSRSLQTVLGEDALCWETTLEKSSAEFEMRQRVVIRSLAALWAYRRLLNPFKYGFFSVQLFSHKLLRYLIAPLASAAYVLALLNLEHRVSASVAVCGSIVLILALIGLLIPPGSRWSRRLSYPYYFVLSNAASLLGLIKFVFGRRVVIWNPKR